jgi:hypothetical protein
MTKKEMHLLVDSQSPDTCPPEPMELTFNDNVPAVMLKDDIVYLDRFDTEEFLPDGTPRCDDRYKAIDCYGDVEWARCIRAATVRVRVTDCDSDIYEAKCCLRCAEDAVKSAGKIGHPLAFEILGEVS